MAYYDNLVDNPKDALDEIARRRSISRKDLELRLESILAAGGDGKHLSLREAKQNLSGDKVIAPEVRSHIQECNYCNSLLDGLNPTYVAKKGQVAYETIVARSNEPILAMKMAATYAAKANRSYGLGYFKFGFTAAVTVAAFFLGSAYDESNFDVELANATADLVEQHLIEVNSLTAQLQEVTGDRTRMARARESMLTMLAAIPQPVRLSAYSDLREYAAAGIYDARWTVASSYTDEQASLSLHKPAESDGRFSELFVPGQGVFIFDEVQIMESLNEYGLISSEPGSDALLEESFPDRNATNQESGSVGDLDEDLAEIPQ